MVESGADATIETHSRESVFTMMDQYNHPYLNQILQTYKLTLKKTNFSENSLDNLDFENENVDNSISVPLSNDMTKNRLSPRRLNINLKRDS